MTEVASRKMAVDRDRLRARGLRPVQAWVADLRDATVRDRLRRDAALVRGHTSTAEGDAFVDAALADLADSQEWKGSQASLAPGCAAASAVSTAPR